MKLRLTTNYDHFWADAFRSSDAGGVVRVTTMTADVRLVCLASTEAVAREIALELNQALALLKNATKIAEADAQYRAQARRVPRWDEGLDAELRTE